MAKRERVIIWTNGTEEIEQRYPWTLKARKAAETEEQKFLDCGYEPKDIRVERGGGRQ